jgi:hypothetical protein
MMGGVDLCGKNCCQFLLTVAEFHIVAVPLWNTTISQTEPCTERETGANKLPNFAITYSQAWGNTSHNMLSLSAELKTGEIAVYL